jgi:hypothetical protein
VSEACDRHASERIMTAQKRGTFLKREGPASTAQ